MPHCIVVAGVLVASGLVTEEREKDAAVVSIAAAALLELELVIEVRTEDAGEVQKPEPPIAVADAAFLGEIHLQVVHIAGSSVVAVVVCLQ